MSIYTLQYPENKKFAFTIFDDTDYATIKNIKPVYDLLKQLKIFTTKSVWVYPPDSTDTCTGLSLEDNEYLKFVKRLQKQGFEIALHNVGSGGNTREKIEKGINVFNEKIGHYPQVHVNHSRNPDNIYWGYKRFTWPLSFAYKMMTKDRYYGEDKNSRHFWGDLHKKHIRFTRNLTVDNINTLRFNPNMPYREKTKEKYSNYYFSSTNGATMVEFNKNITPATIDNLEAEGGVCILYTHFACDFVDKKGNLDKTFEKTMKYIASKGGYYRPVGELLDHLLKVNPKAGKNIGYFQKQWMNFLWVMNTIKNLF